MSDNTIEIIDSPDRENIRLSVIKIPSNEDLEETFAWLIDILIEKGISSPRTIIFCKNKDDCGRLHAMFKLKIQDTGKEEDKGVFEMFHKDTWEHIKDKIAQDMQDPNGHIRILICTASAGMGVNFVKTYNVIQYGPPREMDTFLQQFGRAGRDGCLSDSVILYTVGPNAVVV